ncbi:hypothetical protein [Streptomyces sp. NPDC053560]
MTVQHAVRGPLVREPAVRKPATAPALRERATVRPAVPELGGAR